MSEVKKEPKMKKEVKPGAEPKVRKARTKKAKPTKAEALKLLEDAANEIKQAIQELKEDEAKLPSMGLKRVPELVKDELEDLAEDLIECETEYEDLKNKPDCE